MSGKLSEECIKTALQFLYERSLARAGFQVEVIVTKKSENKKRRTS